MEVALTARFIFVEWVHSRRLVDPSLFFVNDLHFLVFLFCSETVRKAHHYLSFRDGIVYVFNFVIILLKKIGSNLAPAVPVRNIIRNELLLIISCEAFYRLVVGVHHHMWAASGIGVAKEAKLIHDKIPSIMAELDPKLQRPSFK